MLLVGKNMAHQNKREMLIRFYTSAYYRFKLNLNFHFINFSYIQMSIQVKVKGNTFIDARPLPSNTA